MLVIRLEVLPRFLPARCRSCIVDTGLFVFEGWAGHEAEDSREEGEAGNHAGGEADAHDHAETFDALVLGEGEAAEAGDGG